MKSAWMILAAVAALNLGHLTAHADEAAPARVEIPVEALLAPHLGYEEKNEIQVVLYGKLLNSCYTLSETTTERLDERTIRVRQFALHDRSGMCADEESMPIHMKMLVPFTQEVRVGHLPVGEHHFVYDKAGAGVATRDLVVSRNITPSADTLPYAAVSSVQAKDVLMSVEHAIVTISGVRNSTCTTLDPAVKILHEDDVQVLLPTVKVKRDTLCAQVLVPFEKKLDLGVLSPGIHLIHTRSMNGKAVNKVINVMR